MNALITPVLMLFLASAAARQQPATRIKVKTGGTCTFPTNVHLVFNGNEDEASEITLKNGVFEEKRSVHPGDYASLRTGGKRTAVRTYEIEQGSLPVVALFTFKCNEQETTDEHISANGAIDFTYCRRLPKHESEDGLDRDVDEIGSGRQTIVIRDWRFSEEEIRLQLFPTKHKCTDPSLRLDLINAIKQPRHAPVPLGRNEIISNLCHQRSVQNCLEPKTHDSVKDLKLTFTTP